MVLKILLNESLVLNMPLRKLATSLIAYEVFNLLAVFCNYDHFPII